MNSKDSKITNETQLEPLSSTELAAGELPRQILIAPWGEVESTRGTFVVDDEAARATMAAFAEHRTDLPIDFEHQTLGGSYSSPDGLAPAAGWIKELVAVEGIGLMAEVEWTELGIEHLSQRQYRYLSPVAIIRQSDRRMVGLHSAALTNKPAIVGMEPIVNREDRSVESDQGTARSKFAQAEACGSLVKTSLEDCSMLEVLNRLREQLSLGKERGAGEVLAAAADRLDQLTSEQRHKVAEDRVAQAMSQGKLTEAQHSWAVQLVLRDPESFAAWLDSAPVVVTLGKIGAPEDIDETARSSKAVATRARSEYRAHTELQGFTSEEAYVQLYLREAGLN